MKTPVRRIAIALAVAAAGLTMATASSIATPDRSFAPHKAAAASDHVMRARVLTSKSGTEVTVVVRELRGGDVIQERRKTATLTAGEPNRVSMLMHSPYAKPDFQVRLLNDGLAPGESLALQRVRWIVRNPAGDDGGEVAAVATVAVAVATPKIRPPTSRTPTPTRPSRACSPTAAPTRPAASRSAAPTSARPTGPTRTRRSSRTTSAADSASTARSTGPTRWTRP